MTKAWSFSAGFKSRSRRRHVGRTRRLARLPDREFRDLDVRGKSKFLEQPNAVIIGVEFIPRKTVPGGNWIRMVIVMPALAPGKERHPPAVTRIVPR